MGSSMGMLRPPRAWEFQDQLDGDGIEEGEGDVITREIPSSVSIHKLVKLNFFLGTRRPGFPSQLCYFQPVGPQTDPWNPQRYSFLT